MQAEDGIRDGHVTGVQTCALPISFNLPFLKTDQVWSQEGQVESALRGSLYVMAFEEEFANLDDYLEEIEEKYPIVGERIEKIGRASCRERVEGEEGEE